MDEKEDLKMTYKKLEQLFNINLEGILHYYWKKHYNISFWVYDDKIVITGSQFRHSAFWQRYEFSYEEFVKEANDKNKLYKI